MRKIKFRYYSHHAKRMFHDVGFHPSIAMNLAADPDWEGEYDQGAPQSFIVAGSTNMDGTLMQYTGVKDINGDDIYEGDIVRVTNTETGNTVICTVGYRDNGLGRFSLIETQEHVGYKFNPLVLRYKVLGNIYENPGMIN